MRVAFVYPNPRRALISSVEAQEAPDTNLLGQNHLSALGIDAFVYESVLRRHPVTRGRLHRLTWHARELALPWEVRDADLICTPLATLLPLAARVRRRPRVLLISYGLTAAYDRAGAARRRLMRAAVGSAAHVVCISEEGRRRLIAQVGLARERVSTAPLGVDETFWTPAPPAHDGYVLTVGRDLARDYATFAKAMSGLLVRGIVVAKKENLRGVTLPPNIEVRLNIGASEVRELYAGAACVVVPIHADGHPAGTESSGTIALLESMASARPAIVSDRPFLADYLDPARTALLVPSEDPSALRARIAELLGDGEMAARIGVAARAAVEKSFTTRRFAERLTAAIRRLGH
jgi:glycosyltransferase involved in cell wall biosynthesis